MKKVIKLSLLFAMFLFVINPVFSHEVTNISSEEALKKLKAGNERFVKQKLEHPDVDKKRRKEMLKGQHPFVVILSCSDSRVPPEIIFDQGLGDIFEIRNAGNVLNKHVIGSIEYAVMHCGVKLVVVMGHQDCGAINATLSDATETKYIESLKESIRPAVDKCKKENKEVNCENVVKAHIMQDLEELFAEDKNLLDYMKKHNVKVVPAYYNIDTGRVDYL